MSNEIVITYTGEEPVKGRPEDAAYDLRSAVEVLLHPGQYQVISTGTQVLVPNGYAAEVLPRSGLAIKKGITVLNAPGLIDPGYVGDIGVILINHGKLAVHISPGDRIAQLRFTETAKTTLRKHGAKLRPVSERGEQGFGSSGRK